MFATMATILCLVLLFTSASAQVINNENGTQTVYVEGHWVLNLTSFYGNLTDSFENPLAYGGVWVPPHTLLLEDDDMEFNTSEEEHGYGDYNDTDTDTDRGPGTDPLTRSLAGNEQRHVTNEPTASLIPQRAVSGILDISRGRH